MHPRTRPADTVNSQTRVLTDQQQGCAAEAVAVLCGRAGYAQRPPGAPCCRAGFRCDLCPLAHPPQCFGGWLFRDLAAERHRLTPPAAPRTPPVSFLGSPGAGKWLTTHTLPMRRSPRSRGEGPCPGADPRYRKRGRPSSFPGLQGHVSARGGVRQGCVHGGWQGPASLKQL